jgi:hypothetical protein
MLENYRKLEDSIEFHMPGQNYTGPGTHVINRVLDRKYPMNMTDAATLFHDIEYYMKAGQSALLPDLRAIKDSDWSLQGLGVKIGMIARILSGKEFNGPIKNNYDLARRIGHLLYYYVGHDTGWKAYFQRNNIVKPPLADDKEIHDWILV